MTWDSDGEHAFTPEAVNVLAFTQDGSDYRSTLLTRPSFGCISWAAAEIGKALAGADAGR